MSCSFRPGERAGQVEARPSPADVPYCGLTDSSVSIADLGEVDMGTGTTLTRDDYCSPDVFAHERERIFHAGWFYACHADALPSGHRRVVDVAGESVIVARDLDSSLHAHANVCRHRGAQLCEPT